MDNILLTGGTGLLGHYLLAELLRRADTRVRVLLRPPLEDNARRLSALLADLDVNLAAMMKEGRVALLEGALPELELDEGPLAGINRVIHAAANTSFDADASGEPARTNVEGTRAMLALAERIGARHFAYVSTAYVCGKRAGRIPERVLDQPPDSCNAYERSKWDAEQLVWDWRDATHAATICRPTILFGDSVHGRATTMRGLYLIARATEILARAVADSADADRHAVPLRIIGRSDATINVIPVDWAAARVAEIALDDDARGLVHHIANPNPPTHQEIKEWLEAFFDLNGGRFCDKPWPLDGANHYEELFYSRSDAVHDYFRHDLSFESRRGESDDAARLIDREAFFAALRYAKRTNWGRKRLTRNATRPATGETVNPAWYFTEFLPDAIPRSEVARIDALTTVARYIITDCANGEWVCRFQNGDLAEVSGGPNGVREAFGYRVPHDEFSKAVRGRCPLQDVFLEGGAEMFGDIDLALKMVSIMERFLQEFPVTSS